MLQYWASEGEFYIGGFVLPTFVEPDRLVLNELAQYKTTYLELTFARPNAVAFLVLNKEARVRTRTLVPISRDSTPRQLELVCN